MTMSTATEPTTNKGLMPKLDTDPRALSFRNLLETDRMKKNLSAALPKHIPADRLIRVVLGAFQRTPKLLECSPESVLYSILQSAALGLEPDGILGNGYLVPYWNGKARRLECEFIPGYRGLCKLARQSGDVADVWAEVVFEKDQFDYELGLEQKLRHKRNDDVADPGAIKYAYAVARFRDGERKFIVLNRREIERIKQSTSSKDKQGNIIGPWVEHEAEMTKKSAVRRLCKMLPLSPEIQTKISSDSDGDERGPASFADLQFLPPREEVKAITEEAGIVDEPNEDSEPAGELFDKSPSASEV